ncbi:unnamed protein product [Camellia sinensis]
MEAIGTSFFTIPSSSASPSPLDDPEDVLNSIHPPRPDWYEELYAFILDKGKKAFGRKFLQILILESKISMISLMDLLFLPGLPWEIYMGGVGLYHKIGWINSWCCKNRYYRG